MQHYRYDCLRCMKDQGFLRIQLFVADEPKKSSDYVRGMATTANIFCLARK